MIHAAVCCPGPSLPRALRAFAGADVVIAVNRALLAMTSADWLSAGDITTLEDHLPPTARPRIGVLTFDAHLDRVRDHASWAGLRVIGWNAVPLIAEHEAQGRPLQWSVQAGLCLAAHLGATHIDLYGADGAASAQRDDCTGHPGENRTAERWAREEIDLALTMRLLTNHGAIVRRIYA